MSLHLCGDYKHIIVSFATPYGIAYRKHVDHIIPSAGRRTCRPSVVSVRGHSSLDIRDASLFRRVPPCCVTDCLWSPPA